MDQGLVTLDRESWLFLSFLPGPSTYLSLNYQHRKPWKKSPGQSLATHLNAWMVFQRRSLLFGPTYNPACTRERIGSLRWSIHQTLWNNTSGILTQNTRGPILSSVYQMSWVIHFKIENSFLMLLVDLIHFCPFLNTRSLTSLLFL